MKANFLSIVGMSLLASCAQPNKWTFTDGGPDGPSDGNVDGASEANVDGLGDAEIVRDDASSDIAEASSQTCAQCESWQGCLNERCSPNYAGSFPALPKYPKIAVDSAGATLVVGTFESTINPEQTFGGGITPVGMSDVVVSKYGPNGDHLWSHTFGGKGAEHVRAVAYVGDAFVIVGTYEQTVDFDWGPGEASKTAANGNPESFILRLTKSGDFSFVKTLPGRGTGQAFVEAVTATTSGAIAIIGHFYGDVDFTLDGISDIQTSQRTTDLFVVRLAPTGSKQWVKFLRGGIAGGVTSARNDGLWIAGGIGDLIVDLDPSDAKKEHSSGAGASVFLVQLDSLGTLLVDWVWKGTEPDANGYYFSDIASTSAGDVYFSFELYTEMANLSSDLDPSLGQDPYVGFGPILLRFSSQGVYQWSYTIKGDRDRDIKSISTMADGGVLAVGGFRFGQADFGVAPASIVRDGEMPTLYFLRLGPTKRVDWLITIPGIFGSTPTIRSHPSGFVSASDLFGSADLDPGASSDKVTAPTLAGMVIRYDL